jgi:hypothetical protein
MLIREIETVLEQLTQRWNRMDFSAIRELWDPEESEPYYLPEESQQLLASWDAIEAYWANTKATISRLSMRIWDVQAKLLAPDLAVAVYRMHWNGEVTGYPAPLGGDNRVTAIFRRSGETWRFCHYIEAPLAPLLYLKRLYELDVDRDFLDNKT